MNKLWLAPPSLSKQDCYKNKLALPLSAAKSKHLTHDFVNEKSETCAPSQPSLHKQYVTDI